MSDAASGDHPPHPRFALTIGVVGHRPNRLPKEPEKLAKVQSDVELVLDEFADAAKRAHSDHRGLFTPGAETLTLVSALAEGADTIAAKAALARGFKLDVAIPFPRNEYEKDFLSGALTEDVAAQFAAERKAQDALAGFDELIARARSVLELPGRRKPEGGAEDRQGLEEGRAYEAAGLTILSQSDVLLAIWDGKGSKGRGGTPELIAEAVRIGIPIIIVDAGGDKPPELRWRTLQNLPASIVHIEDLPHEKLNIALHKAVDALVRGPSHEQRRALDRWFDEGQYCVNPRIDYPLFLMCLLVVRLMRVTDLFPLSVKQLAEGFGHPAKRLIAHERRGAREMAPPHEGEAERQRGIRTLAVAYGWADYVAIRASQLFRSAFVFNFFFAALAVVVAAFAVLLHGSQNESHPFCDFIDHPVFRKPCLLVVTNPTTVLELAFISFVILNTVCGRIFEWHRRWYEARELAERFRAGLPLWAVGLRPGFFPGEEPTWTGWYARAVLRMQGLRDGKLTGEALQDARKVLLDVLHEQCHYNEVNARRVHRAELVLELIGLAFLVLTAAVAADHLWGGRILSGVFGSSHPHELAIWLSVALPVLATASYGIRFIGDFDGIRARAERTRETLSALITAVDEDPDDLALLRARASSAADAMLGDVSSWRLSAESRGLAIPG